MSTLGFRPIAEGDMPFLRELYASTRADEMAVVPWPEEEKQSFLTMQFEAQHQFYKDQFPDAKFDLVLEDDVPIGRLYLGYWQDEHRLIDIALVPERRGHGLGGRLMEQVLGEAAAAGKAVRIHVEHNNPAMSLYQRLGFEQIEDQGVYLLMEWLPRKAVASGGDAG